MPADDPIARAQALTPLIADLSARIEAERQLPAGLVAALHEARLFRLALPRSLDGAEAPPATIVRVIETIAKADASTAWCLGQATGCAMAAAYLPATAAREIFGPDHAVLAWGPGPHARATAVEGGYRVTGEWSFASGMRHATWLGGHCRIVDQTGAPIADGSGKPAERTMLFPKSAARVADIWHVIGLKGTGSDAFAVTNLFVPQAHSIIRDNDAERQEAGPLYRFTTNTIYASCFAAVAMGLARASLDAFVRLATGKTPRGMTGKLRESAVIQAKLAQSEVRLRAARRFLLGTLEDIWRAGAVTLDDRMTIRMAATHAIHTSMDAVDFAYHEAGATAVFESNPFERRFRDMHAVAQQLQGRHSHFETVGQHLLGLPADPRWI